MKIEGEGRGFWSVIKKENRERERERERERIRVIYVVNMGGKKEIRSQACRSGT